MLTLEEVANELKVSVQTVRRLIDAGKLKAVRVGRQLRVSREALDEYIRNAGV